jgi:hypothetical protein
VQTSVSEIHRYPLRPPGFQEPLFPDRETKRAVAEHLARSAWLEKASGLASGNGASARAFEEPARLMRLEDGGVCLVRGCRRDRSTRERRVVRVLERWREVGNWWEPEGMVDRISFRLLLSGGAVVDVALERMTGRWLWVGTMD